MRLFYKTSHNYRIRFYLFGVIERLQFPRKALSQKRVPQKVVTNMGILGQERSMQVSPHDILIENSLHSVLIIVPMAKKHLPERPQISGLPALFRRSCLSGHNRIPAQVSSPPMVFKTVDGLGEVLILKDDVRNEARTPLFRIEICQVKTLHPAL